jgi:GntR family transcriptional regulator
VEWNDKQPIFQQIKQRIEQQILAGIWLEGEALPSVRKVALDLKINHLTVMKAYQLLVDDYLVEKLRGRGMFVLVGAKDKLKAEKTNVFLNEDIPQLIQKLQLLDIPIDNFIKELNKQIKGSDDAIS